MPWNPALFQTQDQESLFAKSPHKSLEWKEYAAAKGASSGFSDSR